MAAECDTTPVWLHRHGRPILRIGTAALLIGPGVSKFLTYDQSVGFFTTLGLPVPALLVVVVGGLEVGAAVLLFLDRTPWLGALLVIPVMAVAIATSGASWQNVSVLLGGLVVVGTDSRLVRAVR